MTDPTGPAFGEDFADAWPRIVRALASFTGSLDDAEEYAAESVARAAHHVRTAGEPIDSLAAWCTSVGKRAWLDDHRRRQVHERALPKLALTETDGIDVDHPDFESGEASSELSGLDDRLALLFVACDPAISPHLQVVLALRTVCGLDTARIAIHLGIQPSAAAARLTRAKKGLAAARDHFEVPPSAERAIRLPIVLACVAGMFTVAHRDSITPADALTDTGRQALSIADALVATFPTDPEVRGLRAVIRLGLARRPGRLDATGAAVPPEDVDRSRWHQDLLAAGLEDATYAADHGEGRFTLEAAIAGLHTAPAQFADTDWAGIVGFYDALERIWPAPSVVVAHLVARTHLALNATPGPERDAELSAVEDGLLEVEATGAAYAALDASLALADLAWRTGRTTAAARYRDLAEVVTSDPVRLFCLTRAQAHP